MPVDRVGTVRSTTNERTQRSNAALVRRPACVKQDSSHAVQQLRNSLGAEPQFVGLPWVRSLRGHLPVPPPRERDGCASVAPEPDIDVHVCSSPVVSLPTVARVAVMLDQLTVRPSTESAVKMCGSHPPPLYSRELATLASLLGGGRRGGHTTAKRAGGLQPWLWFLFGLDVLRKSTNILIVDQV
jgi:hypothetical protein